MNKRSFLTFLILLSFQVFALPQVSMEKIIMTVAGKEVQAGEFAQMYNKSLDSHNGSDFNNYLEQFINFKLKVADAIAEGYDTTKAFREELKGYRDQLAQSYLTDSEIKEQLLRKAYERSLIEVKASHILINCAPQATPADTLAAYSKAMKVRERLLGGEPFEQVAKAVSDDKSVALNGGNLGYFTIFQMITPFEDAAYKLDTGAISMPVRTPYGYHIIKVIDKRPSKGKIKVAHIMKAVPPGSDENVINKAEQEINDIYTQIKNGGSFRDLAIKYSDDKGSASGGGIMNWFGAGEIIPDFAGPAFSLKDTGEYSKPVRSVYGFHIIKLIDKKAPASYENSKPFLESKISKSYISSSGKKSFIEKLRKEYNFNINQEVYRWFVKNTDSLIISGKSKYDRKGMPDSSIFSFADQHLGSGAFADALENRKYQVAANNSKLFIDFSIESIASDKLTEYENSRLENKYPEFRYLMNEFHDGILLFDISEKKIWNKVQDDSTGLHKYYEDHKTDFLSKRAIEAKIYKVKPSVGSEKLLSAYKKFSRKSDTDRRLCEMFNNKGDTLLSIEECKWYAGDDPQIDSLKWIPGGQTTRIMKGDPAILVIKKVDEPAPLPFDAVQSEIITGYQELLTNEWIKQLKERYPVKVDNLVFEEVKEKLNND